MTQAPRLSGHDQFAFNVEVKRRKLDKLLAAGLTNDEAKALFLLGCKLMHHGVIECNRPRSDAEIAEQSALIEEAANLTRKFDGITAVELGDPRGRVLKVALRKPDGAPIPGDDFGDSRFLCL